MRRWWDHLRPAQLKWPGEAFEQPSDVRLGPEGKANFTKTGYASHKLVRKTVCFILRQCRTETFSVRTYGLSIAPPTEHLPPVKQGRFLGWWIGCNQVFLLVDLQVRVWGVNGLIFITHWKRSLRIESCPKPGMLSHF